jgi:2-polyprenyl-3-methyl-5-hydroxy-6-metoxy-1,4-benzoquinol methylase
MLRFYDVFVLGFSNRFAWRCPSAHLLRQYDRLAGARHLDVGVGTGWFLDRCRWPVERPSITLVDLNENSLAAAASRIRRYGPETVTANVLEPLPLSGRSFESVGINFLLHCLPGQIEAKAGTVLDNLTPQLAPGGVLFGSTILGRGVRHNGIGRLLMSAYNRKGIFSNANDDADGLRRALDGRLADVVVDVIGTVALFSGRRAR